MVVEGNTGAGGGNVQSAAAAAFAAGAWGKTNPPSAPNADEKLWGMLANALGIFWLIGPIVALLVKGSTSPFVKFNAIQMIGWCLVGLALSIVLQIIATVLSAVPIMLTLVWPLFSLIGLAFLVLLVYLCIQAWNG
ncbi:MAG TPA: hypothetical protein VEJ63_21595, partial [Planctomycetota bacterium]|nr:hypothetical protein [Planctomycetota bacterium]